MLRIPFRGGSFMKASDFFHAASDGKKIHVRAWHPSGETKAVLLIAHGMAEHAARYERFAQVMNSVGWSVYVPDHRGHGQTAAKGELGWLAERDGFKRIRDDLHEISALAKDECKDVPVFLYGHSMGSVLAETYIAAYGNELSGCLLTGVVAPMPSLLHQAGRFIAFLGSTFKGQKAPAKMLNDMSFTSNNKDFAPNRSPVDWLSRDTAEVDKYVADPLCGFVCSFGFYRDLLSGLAFLYQRPASFSAVPKNLPLFILAGAEDPVGGSKGFVPLLADKLKAAGVLSVETRLYPGARHEVLNETNRDEVMRDMKDWLERSLAKR
jgi:alpha-beta hydrolase superfamily lysophospholipase